MVIAVDIWSKILGPNWRKKKVQPRIPNKKTEKPVLDKPDKPEEPTVIEPVKEQVNDATPPKTTKRIINDEYEKKFKNVFSKLTYRHNAFEVWSDFVTMFACAISNTIDKTHYDEREKLYLSLINKYDKTEQALFPELVALMTMALDQNPEQDFLGTLFMGFGFGNRRNQQFFTPYHISEFMARISMGDLKGEIDNKGYASVHDPCCGSGVMLIAAINAAKNVLRSCDMNFQNHIFVAGQDIDQTVALMCYIQISLLGVAGYVKVGNSLTEPLSKNDSLDNYWFTPMYFSDVWAMRRTINTFDELLKKDGDT